MWCNRYWNEYIQKFIISQYQQRYKRKITFSKASSFGENVHGRVQLWVEKFQQSHGFFERKERTTTSIHQTPLDAVCTKKSWKKPVSLGMWVTKMRFCNLVEGKQHHGIPELSWRDRDILHPQKLTCPLKMDNFNRKCIFQSLIFRGHVSFPGSTSQKHCMNISQIYAFFMGSCILHKKAKILPPTIVIFGFVVTCQYQSEL